MVVAISVCAGRCHGVVIATVRRHDARKQGKASLLDNNSEWERFETYVTVVGGVLKPPII